MTHRIIFIAIPTKGTVNPEADGKPAHLKEEFLAFLAKLHMDYPSCTFIAPMVQDYQLLRHMSVTATWEDWGKHCRAIIPKCDEVWVLKYNGYDTSVGVAGEIACAEEHNVPVFFINPFVG